MKLIHGEVVSGMSNIFHFSNYFMFKYYEYESGTRDLKLNLANLMNSEFVLAIVGIPLGWYISLPN
jgi:hypothetical protein